MKAEFESAERRLNELLRLQAGGSRQIRIRPGGHINAAPPARPHEEEECLVAEHFFKAMTGAEVSVESGDNPPDCIVQLGRMRRTVELGALFDRTAAEAMRQEEAFTLAINRHASLLPDGTKVGLVMWDDTTQTRTPTDDAAAFPTIVRWLSGCFIDRGASTRQFMIHQYAADRPARMNFPKVGEVEQLARDLASLVASLPLNQSHVSTCTHGSSAKCGVSLHGYRASL